MSEFRMILSNERIRNGLRGILIVEIIFRLGLGIYFWLWLPSAAQSTLLFILPPIGILLFANRLPLLVLVLAFGIEAGSFLHLQVINFGWEAGFPLYLTCLCLATFLYEFLSLRLRIVFAVAPLLGYAFNVFFLPVMEPYRLRHDHCRDH